ncbi:LPD7 domain-containing protein [Lichenicoccus roseus]|uniref:LPD7 domain-containing protein n=1 Tax=Lichenicoccus roseus TaxID=2683649 RepID=UPI0038D0ECD7
MPEGIARNLRAVDIDIARGAVILTLTSGTRIVDRQDRIDVVGVVDDVAVSELVEAVRRRGWDAVEVTGDAHFRRAVAWGLALLDPPVAVASSPLLEADQVEIERLRRVSRRGEPQLNASRKDGFNPSL